MDYIKGSKYVLSGPGWPCLLTWPEGSWLFITELTVKQANIDASKGPERFNTCKDIPFFFLNLTWELFSKISNLKANPWIESRALVCLFIFCVYLCPIYGKVGRADSAGFWSLRACRWCKNKSKLFSGSPDKLSPCSYVLYAYQMPLAFLVHNYIK